MNIYDINPFLPSENEVINNIIDTNNVRIEHIISTGQSSPDNFWYDQNQNEWVVVLEGYGIIEYFDGNTIELKKGNSLYIPAHKKHRVKETANPTIWLAVFFN